MESLVVEGIVLQVVLAKLSCTNSQFTEGISNHKFSDSGLDEERHKSRSSL